MQKTTKATKSATKTAEKKTSEKKVTAPISYYEAVGRRKEATARVRLYVLVGDDHVTMGTITLKAGDVIVNKKSGESYFSTDVQKRLFLEPLRTTNTVGRFAISAVVEGGGPAGQLQAVVHGISRALLVADSDKFRPILKKRGFLKRDPRIKERRKAGMAQKARAGKQSPKR